MSNPNPSPLTRFQPGVSGNPLGNPSSLSPAVRKIRKMKLEDFIEAIETYGDMSHDELEAEMKKSNSVFNKIFGGYLLEAIHDQKTRESLLNRLFGRVKEVVQHTGSEEMPRITLSMPDNGRRAKVIDVETK